MITNFHTNCMGTTSFDGKFPGMRKAQDFIVYPIKGDDEARRFVTIQSDTRIGMIGLEEGTITLTKPYKSGAYFVHLAFAENVGALPAEDLLVLKAHIFGSASGKAGTNGVVYTDNSGAIGVFK